jgi:hypothetical protein
MPRTATDSELEAFARFLARLTLEIERDLRSPEQLQPFMPPQVWQQWQRGRQPGAFRGGTVVKSDIGRPRVERLDELRAIANVVTRTDRERWGALTMRLDATSGRWRATSLQRLYAARHYRTGPPTEVVIVPVRQRLTLAETDRQQASAALRAVERRRQELPPGSTARREVARLSTTWKEVVANLDREISTLRQREELGQQAQRVLRRR